MKYNTQFALRLVPHGAVKPVITYGLDHDIATITVAEPMVITFNGDLTTDQHVFYIDFNNKTNDTPDMAIEIDSVSIEGMCLDRFKWAGLYYPRYPEPWASMQTKVLEPVLEHTTYLGWNGRWELTFSVPIFTWIHHLEHLGWIYS